MAIVVRTLVEPADQQAHDKLQEVVEAGISRLGGPPEGLLVHLGYPLRPKAAIGASSEGPLFAQSQ